MMQNDNESFARRNDMELTCATFMEPNKNKFVRNQNDLICYQSWNAYYEELCSLVRNEVRVDRSLHCGPSTQSCVVISFFFIRQDVLFEDPCTQKHIREREREREREIGNGRRHACIDGSLLQSHTSLKLTSSSSPCACRQV